MATTVSNGNDRLRTGNRQRRQRFILVPRASVSFGHVVGETEALVAAITGCP